MPQPVRSSQGVRKQILLSATSVERTILDNSPIVFDFAHSIYIRSVDELQVMREDARIDTFWHSVLPM
jgi:hypothetical protein